MKTATTLLSVSELCPRYLLANTATFIVREFRDNISVKCYADAHDTELIAQDAMEIAATWELNAKTLTIFYALLVSLSFKTYSEAKPQLDKFRQIRYDFLPDIVDAIESLMVPSTILIVDRYSTMKPDGQHISTSESLTRNIYIPPRKEGVTL